MFHSAAYPEDSDAAWALLLEQARGTVLPDLPALSNLSNLAALLAQFLERTNWVGFYLMDAPRSRLAVGPFVGLPACASIPLSAGVCGCAARERRSVLVPDVHDFPGHIACDGASRSELVVPVFDPAGGGGVLGVVDCDSPDPARFSEADARGLEAFAALAAPEFARQVRAWSLSGD